MNLEQMIDLRNSKVEKIEVIRDKAKVENRTFTNAELMEIRMIQEDITELDEKIKDKESKMKFETSESKTLDSKDIFLAGESIERRNLGTYAKDEENVGLGSLVKGMMTGNWDNVETRSYYEKRNMLSSGTAGVTIPQRLADKVIDHLRKSTAILEHVPVARMPYNNMVIAKLNGEPKAHWTVEGQPIIASEATFTSVELKGKTLACFIPISEQLLDSNAVGLDAIIMNAIIKAMAIKLDDAIINGATVGSEKITGIKSDGSSVLTTTTRDRDIYRTILSGLKELRNVNAHPTHIAMSTVLWSELEGITDSTGSWLIPPKFYIDLEKSYSNNMPENDIIVYDPNALLLGIQQNIKIEVGTTSDQFQRIMKGIRVYIRADLGILEPKAICVATKTPDLIDEKAKIRAK